MGLFDGLFDAFTGKSAKEAADKNAALYAGYGQQAQDLIGQAGNIYGAGGAAAGNYLTDYGGQAGDALTAGAQGAGGFYDQARGAAGQGIEAYAPLGALGEKYGRGSTLYQDALGINGPEGIARAKSAFTTGPGYEFQVNEATDAAARNAAKLGLAGSGNALDAIRSRAQGFAGQEYGSFLDRLGGFISPELAATSGAAAGRAQGYGNIAGLYGQQAGQEATLGQNRATLLSQLGQNLAGNAAGTAAGQAGLLGSQVNVLGNVAGGQASANQQAAQAAQQGSQNFWNGLLNLGGTAIKSFWPQPQPTFKLA